MNNDNTIDFYFSYRSPYSYLILQRMLRLKNEHQVEINFKIVYPIAISCLLYTSDAADE